MRKVVITGLGIFCSIGKKQSEVLNSIKRGICGIDKITSLDTSDFISDMGGEIKNYIPAEYFNAKDLILMDRCAQFAVISAREALFDSMIRLDDENRTRIGVTFGTCCGGGNSILKISNNIWQNSNVKVIDIIKGSHHQQADIFSSMFNISGPRAVITTACSAGANAMCHAFELIKDDRADVMFAGGSDALDLPSVAGFNGLNLLNETPCSPFSTKTGLNLGEGAGFLILEEFSHAEKRGAKIYSEILAYGQSSDAYHLMTPDPEGDGAAIAIEMGLKRSGISKNKVEYINAHGTGTKANDAMEIIAIKKVFGEHSNNLYISSSKSFTGHTLGASGVIETIISIISIQEGILPPTIQFEKPRSIEKLNFIPNKAIKKRVNCFISNSFAFGGNNTSIVFRNSHEYTPATSLPVKRIAVTGLSVISTLGIGLKQFWTNLNNGMSGIKPIEKYQVYNRLIKKAGEINDFSLKSISEELYARRMPSIVQYAVGASKLALDDSKCILGSNSKNIGIIFGVCRGAVSCQEKYRFGLLRSGVAYANVTQFPYVVMNTIAGQVSIGLKTKGFNTTFNGPASSIQAAIYACTLLKHQTQDMIIVGASDELSEQYLKLYEHYQTNFLNKSSTLYFPGEGSGAVILEPLDYARQRKANIYAEIAGYGMTSDSTQRYGRSKAGRGIKEAILQAINDACISAGDISAVFVSSDGLDDDPVELDIIKQMFSNKVAICSTINKTGYLEGTSSLINMISASMALYSSQIPNSIKMYSRKMNDPKYILVSGLGESGSNNYIILKKYNNK